VQAIGVIWEIGLGESTTRTTARVPLKLGGLAADRKFRHGDREVARRTDREVEANGGLWFSGDGGAKVPLFW
jgi:hypothetical protein